MPQGTEHAQQDLIGCSPTSTNEVSNVGGGHSGPNLDGELSVIASFCNRNVLMFCLDFASALLTEHADPSLAESWLTGSEGYVHHQRQRQSRYIACGIDCPMCHASFGRSAEVLSLVHNAAFLE